jgi:hypothetical protein
MPLAALLACGSTQDKSSGGDVIKASGNVIDLRIDESKPDQAFASDADARVGFDEQGFESRMLLYFPKIRELYDENVILSSITEIQLKIHCDEIAVNPGKIKLYSLKRPWSAAASWKSRFVWLEGYEWKTPGGDFDSSEPAITPSIRKNSQSDSPFELAFDVTDSVVNMVSIGQENFGFIVLVEKSDLNYRNSLYFKTANSGDLSQKPVSVLVFSRKDVISP